MGNLVFQATLGGQVNLVGPNTASTFNLNVPAVAGTLVTTGDTGTVTNTMLASSAYTAPGTIGSGTPNSGAFTTLSASGVASFATGSAAAPALTRTGDTNTGIFFPAADTIAFAEGGVEAMRLDSAGNMGLGVTPSAWSGAVPKAIQATGNFAIGTSSAMYTTSNAFYNGTNWIYLAGDAASYYRQTSGSHAWFNAPSGTAGNTISFTQAMTLDASGRLGVGTTSPSARIHASGSGTDQAEIRCANTSSSGDSRASIRVFSSTSTFGGGIQMTNGTDTAYATSALMLYNYDNQPIVFGTNNAERARIDSSGNLLVGTTSTNPTNGFVANTNSGSGFYTQTGHPNGTGSGVAYSRFMYNQTEIGSITQNGTTGVLYNLTSDYRLKNEQQPLTGAKEFVMALQPKKWQWWDGSGEGVGFIAHEFMEVAKYSGRGDKDAVDENGNPVYQSIQPSSSEVMANLVAHIQNLETRLAALENQ